MQTKLNTKQKLGFIFLLIIGNALMALLTFSSEPEIPAPRPVIREDYVNLRISAKLRAELDPNKPVTLVGRRSRVTIPNAFILKKFDRELGPQDFINKNTEPEYLVSIPRELASKALDEELFQIYPNGIVIRKSRRRNYEVTY